MQHVIIGIKSLMKNKKDKIKTKNHEKSIINTRNNLNIILY